MKVSIVIPTMTLRLVKACIDSIIKYTDMDNLEIIVVANGASPDLWEYTNGLSGSGFPVSTLWYPEPLGPVPALNAGIRESKGDFILLLNDDTAILESPKNKWLGMLLEPFSDPKIMAVGPTRIRTHVMGNNELLFLGKDDIEYGFIIFFMTLIRRQAFDEIGLLDESLICGVDLDFCLKLRRRGYLIQQVPKDEELFHNGHNHLIGSFPVWHEGEGTVHDHYGKEQWVKILKNDAETLKRRYGAPSIKASIVIPTYGDSLDILKRCVESVRFYTNPSEAEIIVVSNGCPESVREYINAEIHHNPGINLRLSWFDHPIGFCSAINAGVQWATGEVVILLNNDAIILGKEWLNMLLEPFSDRRVGITGPVLGECSLIDRNFVMFFCAAIRKEVFNQIGLLDTIYDPGGLDDVDFTVRAENAGWKSVRVPVKDELHHSKDGFSGTFPIYHMEHHEDWLSNDILKRNSKILVERYGKKIDRPIINVDWNLWQKKYELLMIQEFLRHEKVERVLEIGTAHGGSTLFWAKIVDPSGHVFTIDLPHGITMIDESPYRSMVTDFMGNSHDPSFVRQIKEQIGEGTIDVFFVDGDHTYEGVKADYDNFYDLVRPGGFIIFHDILESDVHRKVGCFVSKFWNEIKDEHESYEFIDQNKYGHNVPSKCMGVGIIKKSSDRLQEGENMDQKVTAYVSTKDRYHTTLPLALASMINQTVKPAEIVIVDDGEQRDLRDDPVFIHLFKMMDERWISWEVKFGRRIGQVANHQMMLDNAKNPFLWRVDDDNYASPDVLEKLLAVIKSDAKIGAVASLSLVPGNFVPKEHASSMIKDLYTKSNLQWSRFSGVQEVDHLHNTFLFRKEAAGEGYPMNLSPVGHREETMFTYGMKKAGWKLMVVGDAITWHLQQSTGGIRDYKSQGMWDNDEEIFKRWMANDGKFEGPTNNLFVAVLDNGLGDHIEFLKVLPEIRKKYNGKKILLATCYPEVFEKEENVEQISIAEAKMRFNDLGRYDLYKFMAENNWKKSIGEAYKRMYI